MAEPVSSGLRRLRQDCIPDLCGLHNETPSENSKVLGLSTVGTANRQDDYPMGWVDAQATHFLVMYTLLYTLHTLSSLSLFHTHTTHTHTLEGHIPLVESRSSGLLLPPQKGGKGL